MKKRRTILQAKNSLNYLPQLIIGLDSLNDDANYVHIDDVRNNTNYYCPCCKGLIKPRATKENIAYKTQPHFYHDSGGCTEETYIHYICKNWLFEKGCKFIVNNIQYEVENTEIEKTLYTSFGIYKPDIIVTTTIGKIFYFEIKSTNKKNILYIPKWDELGNDVIEVDTRYFINQKYKNDIPQFSLIYSDGECFIKEYTNSDYKNIIATRKLDWKRKDKINYKIQWERLDWFWICLQNYIAEKSLAEEVLEVFNLLDYSDKLWCYYAFYKKACIDIKNMFKENINQHFINMLESFKKDNVNILLNHISPRIYEVCCRTEFSYLDYILFEEEKVKIKIEKGGILSLSYEDDIKQCIEKIKNYVLYDEDILQTIKYISSLPYVKAIYPYSHWSAENYPFHMLKFNIEFEDYIHNQYLKEVIGKCSVLTSQININYINTLYKGYNKEALLRLDNEFMKYALRNNSIYQKIISELNDICNSTNHLKIKVSSDNRRISLLNGLSCLFEYEYRVSNLYGEFEEELKNIFITHINRTLIQQEEITKYINIVNSCKNKLWHISDFDGSSIKIHLLDPLSGKDIMCKSFAIESFDNIKNAILAGMTSLFDYAENYYGIRFMEER